MLDLIVAGGWLMLPILLASILALAIALEKAWVLRAAKVAPPHLRGLVQTHIHDPERLLRELSGQGALGVILAAGATNMQRGPDVMKEVMEDTGNRVVHELERYLNVLGTVALVCPLLGLLGTFWGMIEVFDVLMLQGAGDASVLASGISQALITTAAGVTVAIPALVLHRYFERKVDDLAVSMEHAATDFVDRARERLPSSAHKRTDEGGHEEVGVA